MYTLNQYLDKCNYFVEVLLVCYIYIFLRLEHRRPEIVVVVCGGGGGVVSTSSAITPCSIMRRDIRRETALKLPSANHACTKRKKNTTIEGGRLNGSAATPRVCDTTTITTTTIISLLYYVIHCVIVVVYYGAL